MKFVNFNRKPISMFVMIAFTIMLCFWANQTPAAPAAPSSEKSSTASLENSKSESTGFIEQEESVPAFKKGKKFPWLIVALVVVAGGAAVYFLVLKNKKYTLTVTIGEGVTGIPAAGTSTSKKGDTVNYSYSAQSGYGNLSVTLDGAPVAASGTVTMNANHTLAVTASKIINYTLTVSKGAHVTGTPNNGAHTYAGGTIVNYNYAPESGYSNLEVKLDNVAVAASGTVTMDANHTLTANLKGASIAINSTPAGARIYIDKVDSGHVTPYTFFYTSAVNKNVRIRAAACGYQEHFQDAIAAVGHTVTINWNFVPGIAEDFGIPASSCWLPYYSSAWTTIGGQYRFQGAPSGGSPIVYNYSFSGNYTVSSEMNRIQGLTTGANAIFLGTDTSVTSANGYFFAYYSNGTYGIWRFNGYNFINWAGTYTLIHNGASAAIHAGLNQWNIPKVVKSGSNYTFYINNINLYSFSDATYNPTYLLLSFGCGSATTEIRVDAVDLKPGS
jgi:hypothetical protein